MAFAQVALPIPLHRAFTYRVPETLTQAVRVGVRVKVMFGRQSSVGVVVELTEECDLDPGKIRPLLAVVDHAPVVPDDIMELCHRIARRTLCSLGEALDAAIPAALKKHSCRTVPYAVLRLSEEDLPAVLAKMDEKKTTHKQARLLRVLADVGGDLRTFDLLNLAKVTKSPLDSLVKKGLVAVESRPSRLDFRMRGDVGSVSDIENLTPAQEKAVAALRIPIEAKEYRGFLLYGVTGSGKTEVYLQALTATLAQGRTAVVLVPEIALTPQTVARFQDRCGEVAVLHSSLTGAQRAEQWRLLRSGERVVAIGPRSALFAPLENLGLIIVDEEHENTFKQNNSPRYHARDMAIERARICGATVILGSATPSLESWRDTKNGELDLLELKERPGGARMPQIEVVDMRTEKKGPGGFAFLSRPLVNIMRDRLRQGEQVILFLNRRGFAPVLTCRRCGVSIRCNECSVPLTFHRSRQRLVCHYCAHDEPPPPQCPECGHGELFYLGFGTERVEKEVCKLFPEYRVARMDSDTMARRDAVTDILAAFREKKISILVGTQMIAKGLDFPNVTVVGVVSADTSLQLPDFRASERTFQLVSQVSGRAGRGDAVGVVVVQTSLPGHPSIQAARTHDYRVFADFEMPQREALDYPPFARLGRIIIEGQDQDRVRQAAIATAEKLVHQGKGLFTLCGPAPAPIERIQNRWRWHMILKIPHATNVEALTQVLTPITEKKPSGLRVLLDMDPAGVL